MSACSSTISACGNERDASAAKRIIRTAPRAKFGARKHGIRPSRARPVELGEGVVAEPRRPDHARDAGRQRRGGIPEDRRRRREVDGRVEAGEIDLVTDLHPVDLVTGGAKRPHQHGTDLAVPAEEQDLHAARATASGLIRATAARKRFSLGPIPAAERRSGA